MMKLQIIPLLWSILLAAPAIAQQADADALGAGLGWLIGLVLALAVGAAIGWVASVIVGGTGSGLLIDIVVGIGGSMIASYGLGALGMQLGVVGSLLAAVAGAVLLLLVIKMIRRA